jgi:hypothetical protein
VKPRRKTRLVLERLEDRLTPASFNLVYSGSSLTITQTTALAGATDTLNVTDNITPNMIVLTDAGAGGNTTNVDATDIKNVTLKLLPNTVAGTARTVTYDLGPTGRAGDLKLKLNSGDQTLDINDHGGTGAIQDDLKIRAGDGNDAIKAAVTGSLAIKDSTSISLGAGTSSITLGNTTIGDDLTINAKKATTTIAFGSGVGQTFSVAGNVDVDTGSGDNTLTMGLAGLGKATVSGKLDASGLTAFTLAPGSSVGKTVSLNAGAKPMTYTFSAGSSVGDNVSIRNKGNTPLASSVLVFNGTIGNNLRIRLGNTAGDTISMSGSVGGNMTVKAGKNGKIISLSPTASVGGDFEASLGNALAGQNLVSITGGAKVGGEVEVKLGNTTNPGGNLLDLSGAKIGGDVEVCGGSGGDTYKSSSAADKVNGATSIGGSVDIDFGNGSNSATVSGTVGGNSIRYDGGNGNDTVTIDASSFARIRVVFAAAPAGTTKTVTLGVLPKSAYIDFGKGSGTKTLNLTGTATPVTYPLTVKNR